MITSSKLELALKCSGAFGLPWTDVPTEAAAAGTARHAEQEAAIARGDIPAELAAAWPGYTWRAEVAFAYDVSTGEGRELGQGIGRAYAHPGGLEALGITPLGPFEAAGAADVVGRGPLGELVVVDKKSFDDVTRASANPQVRFLGLCAARAYDVNRCDVALTHEVRALDRAELEAFDLDEMALAVRAAFVETARARDVAREEGVDALRLSVGRQCRWCPAFDACPKQRELVQLVKTDALANRVELTIPFRDDGEAADIYDLWKRLGVLHKRIGAALHARANERPIPLHSGKLYGPVTSTGNDKLDGDIAYDVLRALHGQQVADAAVARRATKKGIRDALSFVGGKGQVAELERKALAAIRAKGGIANETKTEFEEYAPSAQLRIVNE